MVSEEVKLLFPAKTVLKAINSFSVNIHFTLALICIINSNKDEGSNWHILINVHYSGFLDLPPCVVKHLKLKPILPGKQMVVLGFISV